MKISRLAPFAALLLSLTPAVHAAEFSDKQRAEIGEIVREYLLKNPEILIEVSQELEKRKQAAEDSQRQTAITENAKLLFRSGNDLVAGNPDGDVTMVEFFDYNCAWCKKGLPEVLGLIDADKNLRLVMKEYPIFGEESEYAARAALASKAQGKYWQFHLAMLQHEGKINKAAVDRIAEETGLDLEKLKADMKSEKIAGIIDANQQLANDLAISGTPAFIIDKKVIPGYLPQDQLAATIQEVRDSGGCTVC